MCLKQKACPGCGENALPLVATERAEREREREEHHEGEGDIKESKPNLPEEEKKKALKRKDAMAMPSRRGVLVCRLKVRDEEDEKERRRKR